MIKKNSFYLVLLISWPCLAMEHKGMLTKAEKPLCESADIQTTDKLAEISRLLVNLREHVSAGQESYHTADRVTIILDMLKGVRGNLSAEQLRPVIEEHILEIESAAETQHVFQLECMKAEIKRNSDAVDLIRKRLENVKANHKKITHFVSELKGHYKILPFDD